jgi:hypothetical protein
VLTSEHSSESTDAPGDIFATTHWTVVLAAGQRHTPQSDDALEELCRIPPVLLPYLKASSGDWKIKPQMRPRWAARPDWSLHAGHLSGHHVVGHK